MKVTEIIPEDDTAPDTGYELVEIKFHDVTFRHDWCYDDDAEYGNEIAECRAVGWLMPVSRDDVVVISSFLSVSLGGNSSRLSIPKGAIISTTPLAVKER